MIAPEQIISACWVIFFAYWFVSAFHVKKTVEVKLGVGNMRYVLIVCVVLFLLLKQFSVSFGLSLPQCRSVIRGCSEFLTAPTHRSVLIGVISVFLVVVGLLIAIIARRSLGRNWSGAVVFKKDHELITNGIYHYVRHPIYTGVICMGFGTILSIGSPSLFVLFIALLGFIWFKAKQEEILMEKHFSKEYAIYKKRTKAIIPYLL